MADLRGFDANTEEPRNDFDAIPAGDYIAMVVESDYKATKDGQGKYLEIVLEIVEGEYKGRRLWDRLNLYNANAMAVKIARQTLGELCRAVNVMVPTDSQQFHNIPLVVSVKCKKRDDTGELSNEIKKYQSKSEAAKKQSATSAPAATAAGSPPPWQR
jgi:hypothetical protein